MNTLLWFMKRYCVANCEFGSFHENVVKELCDYAEDFGTDEGRAELSYRQKKFLEQTCEQVYLLGGIPYWFYELFCFLIDSSDGGRELREFYQSMTPDQFKEYLAGRDEAAHRLYKESFDVKKERMRDEYEASVQRKVR